MISVIEHINTINAETELDAIAQEHWTRLSQTVRRPTRTYLSYSVPGRILFYWKSASTSHYKKKYANDDPNQVRRHKAFFKYLKKNDFRNTKRIITARPADLNLIRAEILEILLESDFNSGTMESPTQTKFGELLTKKIFNYSKYRAGSDCIEFIQRLNLGNVTCLYCNNETIDFVNFAEETGRTDELELALFDLDHFMPKSQNPFFALSFYNLIPCCTKCNRGVKKSIPFTSEFHINPLTDSFDDFYLFSYNIEYPSTIHEFKIRLDSKNGDNSNKSAEHLKLKSRIVNKGWVQSKAMVDKYLKYHAHYAREPEKLIDFLFDAGYAKEKNQILKFERGKLLRDLLLQVDVKKILIDPV